MISPPDLCVQNTRPFGMSPSTVGPSSFKERSKFTRISPKERPGWVETLYEEERDRQGHFLKKEATGWGHFLKKRENVRFFKEKSDGVKTYSEKHSGAGERRGEDFFT